MKIGILTFHRAHNYGALLQAFSLKKYVEGHGHKVEIVDYWPDYHKHDYKLIPYFKSRRFLGKVKALLLLVVGYRRLAKRSSSYKKFIRDEFGLNDNVKYKNSRDLANAQYDLVIYGSDQIWRKSDYPIFKGFSDVFFGEKISKSIPKITYAASMGIIDVNKDDKNYIAERLKNFSSLGVRESGLKRLVEEVSQNKTELVLDPVFLLELEQWKKLIPASAFKPQKKYIFFYQLVASKDSIDFVNKLSRKFNLEVIEIRGRVDPLKWTSRYFQTGGPMDFLSLLLNSEMVVSTSFHGVAFSLIFEKEFYALGIGKNSERVESLLDKLNISERYIRDIASTNMDDRKKLNYQDVSLKLNELKMISKDYLNSSLEI